MSGGDTVLRVRDDLSIQEIPPPEPPAKGWRGYVRDLPPVAPLQAVTVSRSGVVVNAAETHAPIVRTAKDGSVMVRFPDEPR